MNRRVLLTLLALSPLTWGQQKELFIKTVSPAQAAKAIKANPNLIILDLRTAKEFAQGHIPKAINIDFAKPDFVQKISKLDRKKTYLIHCASGKRSNRSLPTWKRLGFKNITHLKTGTLGWQQVGLALTPPKK